MPVCTTKPGGVRHFLPEKKTTCLHPLLVSKRKAVYKRQTGAPTSAWNTRKQAGITLATHKSASPHYKFSYLKFGQLCGCGKLSQKPRFLQRRSERTQSNRMGREQQVKWAPCRSPPLITAMMMWLVHFCFGAFSLLGDGTLNDKIPPLLKQN